MTQLRTLDLRRNGLYSFAPSTMPTFLSSLDLSENNLTSQLDLAFLEDCKDSLKKLYVEKNSLSNITHKVDMELPNLIEIHASGKIIELIIPNWQMIA